MGMWTAKKKYVSMERGKQMFEYGGWAAHTQLDNVSNDAHDDESSTNGLADFGELLLVS